MAVTSARSIVNLKEKGHFEHENARIDKYTLADELPAQLSELGLRPRSIMHSGYTVRKLTIDDKEEVLNFLRRFFFRDEPMNLAVNLLETPESRCLELEEYSVSTLDEGVSVAAVDETGHLIGMIINGVVTRKDIEDLENSSDKSNKCPNPKFSRILRVLERLGNEAKVWEKLPKTCKTMIEVRIASTHSAWRGRGLMRVLCEESERLAKEFGANAMRMDATSAFSAAVAERLNYNKLYAIRYKDMPDAPQPEPPHVEARVYIKEL